VAPLRPPAPLHQALAAVVLTLADHETPLLLDRGADAAAHWVVFHTGAPSTADAATAAFVVALSLPDLATLPTGTDEAPETSATVILPVARFGAGQRLRLSGPGWRTPLELAVDGLPADFVDRWRRNHALFPRGVDLILCAHDRVVALPRSVSVEEV